MSYSILIPAYKPDAKLVDLVDQLREKCEHQILIVNDGSGDEFNSLFEKLDSMDRCQVINHAVNQGKGRALKTGFNHILHTKPDVSGVVTADADGQHLCSDILKVIDSMQNNPNACVIGARSFVGDVPARSKIGNSITRWVFRFLVGVKVTDTQTGLRGIPKSFLKDCIVLDGERYEYEINMLVNIAREKYKIIEVPIETVYIDDNSGSHFSPLLDSFKIYFILFRFFLSSLSASIIDYVLFMIAFFAFGNVAISLIAARIGAGFYNFTINSRFVFKAGSDKFALLKYASLVVVLATIAYFGINYLSYGPWTLPVGVSKIIMESTLFIASFLIQRDLIFAKKEKTQ